LIKPFPRISTLMLSTITPFRYASSEIMFPGGLSHSNTSTEAKFWTVPVENRNEPRWPNAAAGPGAHPPKPRVLGDEKPDPDSVPSARSIAKVTGPPPARSSRSKNVTPPVLKLMSSAPWEPRFLTQHPTPPQSCLPFQITQCTF
jgi:hypothetical protein